MQTKEGFFLGILTSLDADFNINKSNRKKLLLVEKTKKRDEVCFMKNDEVYVLQDKKNGKIWCDYNKIWSVFEDKYLMNRQQIRGFIKDMMEEHFKMIGLTPFFRTTISLARWKNISN